MAEACDPDRHRSDEELMKAFRENNAEEAFHTLYRRYFKPICLYLQRLFSLVSWSDAEDLAEETFLRVVRWKGQFNTNQPFRNWLFKVAKNVRIDFLRRKNRRIIEVAREFDATGNFVDSAPSPELVWMIHEFLMKLPPGQRAVIELEFFHNFSRSDIAEILAIGTVDSRRYNALKKMEDHLKASGGWSFARAIGHRQGGKSQ